MDSDNLLEEISRNIKQGLLNVIDTYKEIEKKPIVGEWNKLIFRPLTEEEEEDYSNQEWTYIIEGLPDFGEDVLVTDGKSVWVDSFYVDDFVYLSGTDKEVDRIKAWIELPIGFKDISDDDVPL